MDSLKQVKVKALLPILERIYENHGKPHSPLALEWLAELMIEAIDNAEVEHMLRQHEADLQSHD